MEFKRTNSSRGPVSRKPSSTASGTTPLRSNTPTKKMNSAREGANTPPPVPRTAQQSSARKSDRKSTKGDFARNSSMTVPPALESQGAKEPSTTAPTEPMKRSNSGVMALKKAQQVKKNNRVNVYVRVRAFRDDETGDGRKLAVNMKDNTVEVNVPKKGQFNFSFDGCFWSNGEECPSGKSYAGQEDLFEEIGRPMVENALAGYNAAVMAYGQTGSGKTYTSFGPAKSLGTPDEGLIPRVCDMIFSRAANSSQKGVTYTVAVSMLEVYLEDVYDLLNHRKQLSVRNDYVKNTFQVVGNKSIQVNNYKDVLSVLNKAEPLRTYAATNIHDHSSRAHTLFQLEVQAHFGSEDLAPRCAKILLADLAGCERIRLAGTEEGIAFEQARNINLSLLSLGSCIEAVAKRGTKGPIPEFRNSTLTKLLKDYLGGNSISTMMVTIAPSEKDANLSVQTLRFADRAKQVTTYAKVNTVVPRDKTEDGKDICDHLRDEYLRKKEALYAEYQLKGTIEKLLARIDELEAKLRACTDDELALHLSTEIEELQKELTDADYQLSLAREILYGEFLQLEDELRDLNQKIQEMRDEHEDVIENLMGEETGRYEELKRNYESKLRDIQNQKMNTDDEVARLRRIIEELEEQLLLKGQECDDLNAELAALRQKYDNDTASLQREIDELRSGLDQQQTQYREFTDETTAKQAETDLVLNNLRQALKTANDTINEKDASLQVFTATCTQKEMETATTNAKLQETTTRLEDTAAKLEETEAQLQERSAAADNLGEQLDETNQQLQDTAAKLGQTEKQLQETAAKLEETEAQLQERSAAADNLGEQLDETKEQLQETAAKLADTEGKLEETNDQLQETAAKLEETEAQLQERSAAADNLGEQLDETKEQLQETAAKLADTEGKLGQTEEQLQETAAKLADTEGKLEETNDQLQETAAKLEETEAQLQERSAAADNLGEQLDETKEQLQETAAKLADTEGKLEETNDQLQETAAKLEETEAQLQERSAAADNLGEQLDETKEQLQETAAKLADTEGKLGQTEEQLQETAAKLADTEGKLEETNDQLQETAAKLEETEAQLQERSAAADNLGEQLDETKEQLQETAAKLEETEAQLQERSAAADNLGEQLDETKEQLQETAAKLAETEGIEKTKRPKT
ncbi:Microtubule binding/Kinesin motor domain containing protein, putative [Angomonas deanei]|uniref:Microtubule binding/Kinesin motor domain containing protein, putative n=1 Tax=Angomonas deanei TaxID=59799 RepID=A0A7G2CKJ5_9TRYP|nr:Microtubule binding/Kinesin motor domain containing protein, putative [Angomonas deanei]